MLTNYLKNKEVIIQNRSIPKTIERPDVIIELSQASIFPIILFCGISFNKKSKRSMKPSNSIKTNKSKIIPLEIEKIDISFTKTSIY